MHCWDLNQGQGPRTYEKVEKKKGMHCWDSNQGPLDYGDSALTSTPQKHHS